MQTTIANLSGERLEQEIAAIYYRGAREAPGVQIREAGLLADLWAEFDYRLEEGLIDPDPLTGNEVDYDDV